MFSYITEAVPSYIRIKCMKLGEAIENIFLKMY